MKRPLALLSAAAMLALAAAPMPAAAQMRALSDPVVAHPDPESLFTNPLAASGLEGVINYFVNVAKREPTPTCDKLTSPIVAVQAEGDFVTVMIQRELPVPGIEGETYTTTWFDSWRFVDGKADEHWDPATLPAAPPPQTAGSGEN